MKVHLETDPRARENRQKMVWAKVYNKKPRSRANEEEVATGDTGKASNGKSLPE